jgi:hypothetical protein
MAQAVSRWFLTAEARVRAPVGCGGQSDRFFSSEFFSFPSSVSFHRRSPLSYIISRPVRGRSSEIISSHWHKHDYPHIRLDANLKFSKCNAWILSPSHACYMPAHIIFIYPGQRCPAKKSINYCVDPHNFLNSPIHSLNVTAEIHWYKPRGNFTSSNVSTLSMHQVGQLNTMDTIQHNKYINGANVCVCILQTNVLIQQIQLI